MEDEGLLVETDGNGDDEQPPFNVPLGPDDQ